MQQDLFEFVNNQRWTEDVVAPEERIKCDIIINIKKMQGQSTFVADVVLKSNRPIFGTDYDTPLFNYIDQDVPFDYQQGQPLFYTPGTFANNLTSVVAFYVHIILGYDYDSFERKGGEIYFDKANEIALNAGQQSGDDNWTDEGKNNRSRYNFITDLLNPQYSLLREGTYKYHRLSLDNFANDQLKGRKNITEILNEIKKVFYLNPNAPIISSFFEAKAIEITNIFEKAPTNEKQAIVKVLREIDASNMDKYNRIMRGGRGR